MSHVHDQDFRLMEALLGRKKLCWNLKKKVVLCILYYNWVTYLFLNYPYIYEEEVNEVIALGIVCVK